MCGPSRRRSGPSPSLSAHDGRTTQRSVFHPTHGNPHPAQAGSVSRGRPAGAGRRRAHHPDQSPWPITATREPGMTPPRTGAGTNRNPRNRSTRHTPGSAHPANAKVLAKNLAPGQTSLLPGGRHSPHNPSQPTLPITTCEWAECLLAAWPETSRASSGKRQPSSGGDRPRHTGDISRSRPRARVSRHISHSPSRLARRSGRAVRLFMNDEFGNTVMDPVHGGARQRRTETVEDGNLEHHEITPCEHGGRSRRAGTSA